MRHRRRGRGLRLCAAALLLAFLAGCTAIPEPGSSGSGKLEEQNEEYTRTPPPLLQPEWPGTNAQQNQAGDNSGVIDMSNLAAGYVAACITSPAAAKFRVTKDGVSLDFDINSEGNYEVFSLSMGAGYYEFSLWYNLQGNTYSQLVAAAASVEDLDEFGPFLVPTREVYFDEDSGYVQMSYELAQHCETDLQVLQQIYGWIVANIRYDIDKAAGVAAGEYKGYHPDLEEILQTKMGICYDYAAMAAAMLRANGIPCKLIKGDVNAPGQGVVYHAWNEIWLDEVGWITVKIQLTPGQWQRIDTTFDSAGASSSMAEFIGSGENYVDLYVY